MAQAFDLVIRGGLVVDGSGGPSFEGDVAIQGGDIVAVGVVDGDGVEEIDARGRIVTPGFVDLHTHYNGQATWEHRLTPSSDHGVSTVVMGNCGVGFAPCRTGDREDLIALMEGVEDIPGVVMAEGLPWNWETFPQYLDALDARRYDVNIAAQAPHSAIRVYVMGSRGSDRESSSGPERAAMRKIVREAIAAGAIGVSSSRSLTHRRRGGELAPSVDADVEELIALGMGLKDAGAGVFQLIPEVRESDAMAEFDIIERLARETGRPVSFTMANFDPDAYRLMLDRIAAARAGGLNIRGQTYVRAIGVLYGLNLSIHPHALKPSFRLIADLPLEEKARRMRDPALRARLLAEESSDPNPFLMSMADAPAEVLFRLGDPPNYVPAPEQSIAAMAARRGVPADEMIYDLLLEDEGRAILYRPGAPSVDPTLSANREMMAHDGAVLGLGDGGAHYGMICDAAYPTFLLTHWVRDAAPGEGFDLPWAVRALSRRTAETVGLLDRGLIAPGYRADLNVIDLDRLHLQAPRVEHDLPAGGKRLTQKAKGYDASIVSGRVTYRDGEPTGELPGRLIRGGRRDPSPDLRRHAAD